MCSEETVITSIPDSEVREIEAILGYKFQDLSHLINALTRRSYWHENRDTCEEHNERLEFLGDAVLGLVIADILYHQFPGDEEGELQKKRASLVNRSALAMLMRNLALARYIRMGRGDELSGCRDRDSILSDTLEAVIAAVYLDGGYDEAAAMIGQHFLPLIESCTSGNRLVDCKSLLQERVQAQFGTTPVYHVVDEWGEDHSKTFSVAVYVGDEIVGIGTGKNKREAAQRAARQALKTLDDPR